MAEIIDSRPNHADDQSQAKAGKPYFREMIIIGIVALAVVLGVSLWASHRSNNSSAYAQVAPQAQVSITAQGFSPQTLKVKPGTIVTWTNTDAANHQVEADPYPTATSISGFDNDEILKTNDTMSFTFDTAGTYTYNDRLNPYSPAFEGTVQVSN